MFNSNFFQSLTTDIKNRNLLELISDTSISRVDYLVSKSISYTDIISSGVTLDKVKDIGLKGSYLSLFGPIETNADIISFNSETDYVVVRGNSLPFSIRLFILLREKIGRDIEDYLESKQPGEEVNWDNYPKSLLPTNLRENKVVTELSAVIREFDREDNDGFINVIFNIQSLLDTVKRSILLSLATEENNLVKSLVYSTCVYTGHNRHIIDLANPSKGFFSKDYRKDIIDKVLDYSLDLGTVFANNVLDTIALRIVSRLSIDILNSKELNNKEDKYGNI